MAERDEELIGRVRRGDREAFGQLYDRYAGLVRSVCFEATGDVVNAQDLSQEVFLCAFRQLDQLNDPSRFCAWLVGISRLSGREWRRTRHRDRHEWAGDLAEEIAGPARFDHEDRWSDLRAALDGLSEDERLGIHLFYLEEQPAELARQLLNLSLSGFYRLLDRARDKLAQRLKTQELEP
jgi:RNA polymerase sigma-70 factor (ECF subfamily)